MARAEAREMVFSLRAVFFVLMYGLLSGGLGYACNEADQKTEGQVSQGLTQMADMPEEQRTQMIDEFSEKTGFSRELTVAMVQGGLPWQVVAVLFGSTFVIPGLIMLIGFNRISGDIHSKYTRYVLQRVHRGPYLAGKIFGHWAVCFLALVLVQLGLLILGSQAEMFELQDALSSMPRIWAGFALFVLAYVAFNALFSSMFTPPIATLMLSLIALFGLWFIPIILGGIYEPLRRAWLGSWDVGLWGLDPSAVGVYAGYTTLFVALSYLTLRRRDL